MTERFVRALPLSEVPDRTGKAVELEGRSILVCKSGDEVFAVENQCSHADSPLEGGRVRKHHISCPLHGMLFDMRTGEPKGQLTRKPICVFTARVVEGDVEVDLGAAD